MPLTAEQIAKMDAALGGNIGLTPERMAEMDAALGLQEAAPVQQVAQPTGIAADLLQRGANVQQLQQQRRAGEITRPEEIYRSAGQGAGAVMDVSGAALKAVLSGANALTDGKAGEALGAAGRAVGNVPLPFTDKNLGQAVSAGAQKVGQEYGEFKQEHPRVAGMAEATGNLAMVIPSFVKYADDIAKGLGKTGQAMRPEIMPSEVIRQKGGDLFKLADQQGGVLSPQFADDFLNKIAGKAQTDDFITAVVKKGGGTDSYKDLLEVAAPFQGQPMTLSRAEALDEVLGGLAYKNVDKFGKIDDVGRQYLDMQQTLRNAIENAPQSAFIGGKQGFETAKEARKYWAAHLRMRDVERIIENAERFDTPAKSIQTGFRTLLRNGDRLKGYTPAEVKAMEKAARTGIVTDFFRMAGSGLVPIVAGTGGAVASGGLAGSLAALPAYGIQQGSKKIAQARQFGRAKDVAKEISKRVSHAHGNAMLEAAKTAVPVAGAFAPAALADITMQQFMALPKEEQARLLGAR